MSSSNSNCTELVTGGGTTSSTPTLDDVATSTVVFGTLIFALTWVLMARKVPWLPIGRTAGTLCGAVLVVVCGILDSDTAYTAINFETLALLFGTMVMTILLEREGFFGLVIRVLSWRCTRAQVLLVRVCVITGFLAALVTNDTVCVFLTPIVAEMCHRHNLPYGPYLIALATSANIGSTLTPVGNPQNMIIASLSHLPYVTFVARIGLSTVVCMAVNIALLLLMYRHELAGKYLLPDNQLASPASDPVVLEVVSPPAPAPAPATAPAAANSDGGAAGVGDDAEQQQRVSSPTTIELTTPSPPPEFDQPKRRAASPPPGLGASAGSAAAAASGAAGAAGAAGASAAASSSNSSSGGVVIPGDALPTLVVYERSRRKLYAMVTVLVATIAAFIGGANLGWAAVAAACVMLCIDFCEPDKTLKEVDWGLLVFFSALFIVVRGFQLTGIPGSVWRSSRSAIVLDSGGGLTLYVVLIVVGSNTVSNVPLVLLLADAIPQLPDPRAGWLLLSFISTVAGNFTLVGSVANLIVCERAKRWYTLTFSEYLRFGLPSTVVVVLVGTLLLRAMLYA